MINKSYNHLRKDKALKICYHNSQTECDHTYSPNLKEIDNYYYKH